MKRLNRIIALALVVLLLGGSILAEEAGVPGEAGIAEDAAGETELSALMAAPEPPSEPAPEEGSLPEGAGSASAETEGVALPEGAGSAPAETEGVALPEAVAAPAAQPPAPVAFPASLTLGQKEQATLNGLAVSGGLPVSYVSSKPKVVGVDESGVVTAHRKGSASVTCLQGEAVLGVCEVTVLKAPKKLAFPEKSVVLGRDETRAFPAALPKGCAGAIQYASDNPGVLSVDGAGNLTGVSGGTATLTATAYNGRTATCAVRVLGGPAPSWMQLSESAVALPVKGTAQLEARFDEGCDAIVTYGTSNKKVASVSQTGLITAKKAGQATITATTQNGLTATCAVTVYAAPKKVTLNAKKLRLRVNDGYQLVATLLRNSVSPITWSSSDPGVATVDGDGLVAALSAGLTTITAATANGKRASCKVTVLDPDAGGDVSVLTDIGDLSDKLEIHFLSVGGVYDDVIILHSSAGAVLIDGGRERSADHYGRTRAIHEYLTAMGVDRLDYMIGSHLDENHVGVQGWLPDHMPVGAAYYPVDPQTAPSVWCEGLARRALQNAIADGVDVRVAKAGETRFRLGDMEVCFIGTREEDFTDETNSTSIVNLVRYGNTRFLFPGDQFDIGDEPVLSHLREDAAKLCFGSLQVDMVKWPHHGNSYPAAAFWAATGPSLIVVPNNGGGSKPTKKAVRNARRNAPNASLYRLSSHDSITLVSDGSTIRVYYDVDPTL